MRLVSIDYSEHKNDPREWKVSGLRFKDVNLVVGKNAVGKSKVLQAVIGLSVLLSAGTKLSWDEGKYDVHFDHDGTDLFYRLEIHGRKVVLEEFRRDDKVLLTRGEGGRGEIYAEQEKRPIAFQTPEDELAVVTRRDSLQHSYLEPLYQWASKVLFYHFGSALGRDNLVVAGPAGIIIPPLDFRDERQVIGIYHYGYEKFKEPFDKAILEDMQAIGYDITDIKAQALESIKLGLPGQFPAIPFGMAVQEKDLPVATEHLSISTGMFRALSIFVQLNRAFMDHDSSLVLIDDIGEGLDYERSCLLINRLMSKALQAGVQLIMSTNDRYVMNAVPLENWLVLQRKGGHVRVFDYENSREAFDDFKFTGLNNFDFFAYDYLNDEVEAENQHA